MSGAPRRLSPDRATRELAARDAGFAALVERVGPCDLRRGRPRLDHFGELSRAVCYQQLAGRAAATIHGRFVALFDGSPTPEAVLATPVERLRAAGLSGAKAASIRDLAARALDGSVVLEELDHRPDEAIVAELTTVRGIGRWTAEMFLIFQLGRPDVWPVSDLGVRRGFARLRGWDEWPSPSALGPLGDPFRPYRTVLAWYCWRAVDTVLP